MKLKENINKYRIYRELVNTNIEQINSTQAAESSRSATHQCTVNNSGFTLSADCTIFFKDYDVPGFFRGLLDTDDDYKYCLRIKNDGGLKNAPAELYDTGWLARWVYNWLNTRGEK